MRRTPKLPNEPFMFCILSAAAATSAGASVCAMRMRLLPLPPATDDRKPMLETDGGSLRDMAILSVSYRRRQVATNRAENKRVQKRGGWT